MTKRTENDEKLTSNLYLPPPDDVQDWPLSRVRDWVEENRFEGVICPCCFRPHKVRPRSMNDELVRYLTMLVKLYRQQPRPYHVTEVNKEFRRERGDEFTVRGGDYAKLRLPGWELVESRGDGKFVPTARGIDFAEGREAVPATLYIIKGQPVGWSEQTVELTFEDDPFGDELSARGIG